MSCEAYFHLFIFLFIQHQVIPLFRLKRVNMSCLYLISLLSSHDYDSLSKRKHYWLYLLIVSGDSQLNVCYQLTNKLMTRFKNSSVTFSAMLKILLTLVESVIAQLNNAAYLSDLKNIIYVSIT